MRFQGLNLDPILTLSTRRKYLRPPSTPWGERMGRLFLTLALCLVTPSVYAQTATTKCAPDRFAIPRGTVVCTTTVEPTPSSAGSGGVLSAIIRARIADRQARQASAPTIEQLLRFMAVLNPIRRAAADSIGLSGSERDAYWKASSDSMVELFKVYPEAPPDVIHLVLDPITARFSGGRKE